MATAEIVAVGAGLHARYDLETHAVVIAGGGVTVRLRPDEARWLRTELSQAIADADEDEEGL